MRPWKSASIVAFAAAVLWVAPRGAAQPIPTVGQAEDEGDPVFVQPVPVLVDPRLAFERVVVGSGDVRGTGARGGQSEKLIYSNTLGISAINFPANFLVSDDIATLTPDGCNLRRFRFKVIGRVFSTQTGGPFTVEYGLYTTCPLSVGPTNATAPLRELVKIPETSGELSFPDDAARMIEHVIDQGVAVPIPANLYLGLQFNRANCGTIVGAPATVGFSADQWDFPGFPCNGFLGGFPQLPHASFWAEVYGDSTCTQSFPGYKVTRASGPVAIIGADVQGVDDVHLQVRDCRMVGYEVVVKGVGFYTFDLRSSCDGQIIPGTQKNFFILAGATPLIQVARFTFDPPIQLPDDDFFLGFRCSSNISGVVIAGIEPFIGENTSDFFTIGSQGCVPVVPTQGVHGAVNLAITCAGQPPSGACCDMALTECQGGPDDGKRCPCNGVCVGGSLNGACCSTDAYCAGATQPSGLCIPYCATPGSCEALCRELPQMNCAWPPANNPSVGPAWVENGTCESPPFTHTCGLSACCKPDDTCENLTKNECNAVEPLDRPRLWQAGEICYEDQQTCPFNACLALEGDCTAVHSGTGCNDPFCCADVCDFDAWCCQVAWDEICLRWADSFCPQAPSNDQCAPDFPIRGLSGAFNIPVPGVLFGTNSHATISQFAPGFCCHRGIGTCDEGPLGGEPCLTDRDCDVPGWSGQCGEIRPMPGDKAYGTVWHKFVATHSTAKISTCGSQHVDPRFTDSLIQVFAAQDQSSPLNACNSLGSVACNDDAGSACPGEPGNAQICVGGLTPGQTYFVMLGSKLPKYQGLYRIEITSPCEPEPSVPGDSCLQPVPVTDGVTPFDTAGATFDCPAEACLPDAQNDLWFAYTATCTGQATFSTCGAGDPDTSMAVYDDCTTCPDVFHNSLPLACNKDAELQECFLPARVVLPVRRGHCYMVRVADQNGAPVSGELTMTCRPGCPGGFLTLEEPPSHVVDARRPHFPGNPNAPQGIDSLRIVGSFSSADSICWNLCESSVNVRLHPSYTPDLMENEIVNIVEDPPAIYRLFLKRPITPGETTTISYTDDQGGVEFVSITSHPGNVDGNVRTQPADLLTLIDALNGITTAPWGIYSTDCDHSGGTTPADILCVIDLLNEGWAGTSRPPTTATCP